MTAREVLRLLRQNGWQISEGANHHLATHPDHPGVKIPVSRHESKDIPIGTLNKILKAAGLK